MKPVKRAGRLVHGGARVALGTLGLLAIASCSAKAEDSLLASDLLYFKQQDGWTRTIEIDPWLASRPDLVRHLRSERSAAMEQESGECLVDWGCSESSDFHLHHNGDRLVSIVEEQMTDDGGAHPVTGVADYLYDLKEQKRIRFGDLFNSWAEARPLIQQAFCEQLQIQSEDVEHCPDIQKQALSLTSFPFNAKVQAFLIETHDYALGYYAAGRAEERIEITPQLYSLIRSEYQVEFEEGEK